MTRHDLDLFSLLSGLVLTGIALAALFDVGIDVGPWVWPTVLIGVGVVVLVAVLTSRDEPADPAAGADPADGWPHNHRDTDDAVLADARAEVEGVDHTADHTADQPADDPTG